jgi:hypothetical protein
VQVTAVLRAPYSWRVARAQGALSLLACLAAQPAAAQAPAPEQTPGSDAAAPPGGAPPSAPLPSAPQSTAESATATPAPGPGAAATSAAPPRAEVRGPDDRRPLPDYEGREHHTSVGQALLWVPRVVLFPAYLVSEYVLRRPIGWLVSTAEQEHWPTLIINFFTFGDRQGGIVPTWYIDYGLRPSFGVYAFWNDFLVANNDLRFRAAYGGDDLFNVRLTDRFPLAGGTFGVTGLYDARPDNVFYGVGADTVDERARYYRRQTRAFAAYDLPWVRSSHFRFGLGVREVDLNGDRHCCDDPSVNEQVQAGAFPLPPGMNQVYDVVDQAAELVLDSRWPRSPATLELASDYVAPPGTGARLALRADLAELTSQSLAAGQALADNWIHYGASLGGFWDVTGQQRALGLTAIVDFVDPIGSGAVPLSDLVSLGGDRPLQGFLPNQFVDRSSAALRFEYRWPVAVWLDGQLLYEVGNVFGKGLSGFDLGDFRSSYGVGLAAVGAQDHKFELLIAVGTTSFDTGGQLDSFRFVLGTTAGF